MTNPADRRLFARDVKPNAALTNGKLLSDRRAKSAGNECDE